MAPVPVLLPSETRPSGVLHPWLMARKVRVNPLSVPLSVLPDSMLNEPDT